MYDIGVDRDGGIGLGFLVLTEGRSDRRGGEGRWQKLWTSTRSIIKLRGKNRVAGDILLGCDDDVMRMVVTEAY